VRGIVFDGARLVATDRLELRPTGAGEVRVRMLATGICHSDLNVVDGASPRPGPVVLGHEGAGEVIELGPGVDGRQVGEHVVIATMTPCGHCRACSTGRPADCPSAFGTGGLPFALDGVPVASFANASTWAEEVVVRAEQLFPIAELTPTGASLLGCAVSTGYGNVHNVARVRPGDSVAVVGIGGIGVNVLQAARLAGAATILAIDVHESRRAAALHFGATDVCITAPGDDVAVWVRDRAAGGVDHAFECAGIVATIESAIAMTGTGGTAILIGMPPRGTRASFDIDAIFRGRRIVGALNGACLPARDFPAMIDLARRGGIDLQAQVTEVYPFHRWEEAIAATRAGRVIRTVIDFTA
jgi:S-(hydroxymethyl)glutathione dehydrogenase / alcohol dehydrogenase